MKKTISEKGSISVFVIVAFIFCMTILVSMYWSSTNYQVTVLQAEQRIRDVYEEDVNNRDKIHENLSKPEIIEGDGTGGSTGGDTTTGDPTVDVQTAIAKVNDVYYTSIENAVNSISNTGIVEMCASTSETTTIPIGKAITLILNGTTIGGITNNGTLNVSGNGTIQSDNSFAIDNYGEITIGGNANIYSNSDSSFVVYNQDTGKMNITGGTIEARGMKGCIYVKAPNETNPGEVIISGGNINSKASNTVDNRGKTTIGGSAYISSDSTYPTVYSNHTLIITGGTITRTDNTNRTVSNYGELIMEGGNLEGGSGLGNRLGAKATITGGVIYSNVAEALSNYGEITIGGNANIYSNSDSSFVVYNQDTGKMNITGGTIEARGMKGCIYVKAPNETNPGEVIISGGNINSKASNTVDNRGKITIGGSAYISSDSTYPTVYSNHTLIITGGTITRTNSTGYSVRNEGGTVTHTGGTIIGATSGF